MRLGAHTRIVAAVAVLLVGLAVAAQADCIEVYVDAAPNKYGSPDYAGWEADAFAAAADGTFVNMANGFDLSNVGTTDFVIQDEVVYSFGDLGRRLTWVYWVPDETVASLEGNFEIRLENWWDGEYLDFYDDYYGTSWVEPTTWVDYDRDGDGTIDGVIGTAGMAWWGAYGVNTQEALDLDIALWAGSSETWKFSAQKLDGSCEASLVSNRDAVPEPTSVLLLGLGLIGVGLGLHHRRR